MRVWFNRHFSVVARVARLLRENGQPLPIDIAISHRHADFVGYATADIAFTEPAGLPIEAYVDWILEKAVAEKIDVIVPGHEASAIVAAAPRFAERGVRVFKAATAEVLPQLHRKQWVYEQAPADVRRPTWELVTEDAQLDEAVTRIEQTHNACIKPTVSVYGLGYHRLASSAVAAQRELARDELSLEQWRGRYGVVRVEKPQMVMQHLPGHEYSADMACDQGQVLALVIRRKPLLGAGQLLVEHPEIETSARALVERFALSGLINIQFKEDADGRACLLEINPRASGGIGMSCLSGLNLPDIAYRACLFGERPAVPAPRLGIRVAEMPLAVILPHPRTS
ncbi:MAG: ATP-grasp domain-containing protein [Panacagrimonas sp.]